MRQPRDRILVFIVLTVVIYLSKYEWLTNLSIWQYIGWESAPSIGLTRAYWLFLHGDIGAAWERNPLIFLVIAVGLPIIVRDMLILAREGMANIHKE